MSRAVLLSALAVLLAACEPQVEPADAPPGTDPEAKAAKIGAGTVHRGGPLTIQAGGVGPILPATGWSEETIKALFPDMEVSTRTVTYAENSEPFIVLFDPVAKTDVLWIQRDYQNRVAGVTALGGDVRGPTGEKLLARYADLRVDPALCSYSAEGLLAYALRCAHPTVTNVTYVFGIPGWTGEAPPPPAVLREKAFLRQINWSPLGPT